MTDGSCRITVVGPARRADLTLPSDIAVAELIPELVQLLDGEQPAGAAPPHWSLLRVGGGVLDPEASLQGQAVLDGTMLFLRDITTPPEPPVVEDIVESVAIAVEVRPGRWTGSAAGRLWTAAAAACALATAWVALAAPAGTPRAVVSLGPAGLLVAAAGLLRAGREPGLAAVVALAALPLWAVGGASLAALADPGAAAAVAGATAAMALGALVAWLAAPPAAAPAAAAAVAVLPAGAVVAAGAALGADAAQEGAVLAVAVLVVVDQLPRAAALVAGLEAADGTPAPAPAALRARVDRGHRTLAWLLAGTGLPLAGALVALALSPAPLAWALCAVAALAAGLRARRFHFTAEVVPLAAAALAGPLVLEAALGRWLGDRGPAGAAAAVAVLLGSAAGALALALAAPRLAAPSPRRRRLLDLVELLANLALVPLVIGVLGLYALVYQVAHRLA